MCLIDYKPQVGVAEKTDGLGTGMDRLLKLVLSLQ